MRSILTLLLLALATPAFAADGVHEINQTCAVQTGCFAGDAAGFPVQITASGSYILTSNLTGIPIDIDGIFVSGRLIMIDFNGFSLSSGAFGSGTGNGITGLGVDGQFVSFTTIKNGMIRGFGGIGIALGLAKGIGVENMIFDANAGGGAHVGAEAQILKSVFSSNGGTSILAGGLPPGLGALIEGNVVSGSGEYGIEAGNGSTVLGNTAYLNGFDGIKTNGATVSGNTAYQNGIVGIRAGFGSTVSGNTAYQNVGTGISADSGSTVSGNTTRDNGNSGMFIGSGSTVSGNTTHNNGHNGIDAVQGCTIIGNTAFQNGDPQNPTFGDGIECDSGCLIRENNVRSNTGYGLNLGTNSAYRENIISNNTTGWVTGTGVDAGANVINGTVTTTP